MPHKEKKALEGSGWYQNSDSALAPKSTQSLTKDATKTVS